MTNESTARSSIRDIGFSRNKSLRTLEVTAWSVDDRFWGTSLYPIAVSSLLKRALSTVTSPAFLEVIVLYRYYDFRGIYNELDSRFMGKGPIHELSKVEQAQEAFEAHRRFEIFRSVQKVRDFQLVLCADVRHGVVEYSVGVLKETVAVEKAKGMFDDFSSEPTVIYNPRAVDVSMQQELYASNTSVDCDSL